MLVLRPVEPSDLPQLQQLARESLVGVTSLPDDSHCLLQKIRDSQRSFASPVQSNGRENYCFVLHDLEHQRLLGCAEIVATAGYQQPFYSLRNRPFISASRELNVHHGVPALSLCQDLSPHTLLRGLHIDAELQHTAFCELLSRARLMFIAAHPQRFAEAVITEIVGYSDAAGESPFWNALGKHFFNLSYVEAERLCGLQDRSFLAELMPHYPIYVPMLTPDAQACIGRVHPAGQEAFDILEREGFETNSYVDLFDAGPTLFARTPSIRSIAHSRTATARRGTAHAGQTTYLICNDAVDDFRAMVVELDWSADEPVTLDPATLAALHLTDGSPLRLVAL
ncbi:arginine N-succinyltransferase [Pseudomonas sp. S04]|jgi:arginine N-succinyltransferase|uniref:arginine N-succinyltransferase n=1 Tax=unclassified Pseudomonas TaxID=196821 RepID=UPI00131FC02C|nr:MULTISPECIES: arginine N-succinyltransferase [unclassified Pseudomonas]QHD00567.1 arginine N-succinyltransferase [Pseudomonas sp. S04]QHF33052.1 arginine N-succinyltransferase [Pseudomonas sp. S19]